MNLLFTRGRAAFAIRFKSAAMKYSPRAIHPPREEGGESRGLEIISLFHPFGPLSLGRLYRYRNVTVAAEYERTEMDVSRINLQPGSKANCLLARFSPLRSCVVECPPSMFLAMGNTVSRHHRFGRTVSLCVSGIGYFFISGCRTRRRVFLRENARVKKHKDNCTNFENRAK